eukprot:1157666-Pelagomonas_calceolata.AAC.3
MGLILKSITECRLCSKWNKDGLKLICNLNGWNTKRSLTLHETCLHLATEPLPQQGGKSLQQCPT